MKRKLSQLLRRCAAWLNPQHDVMLRGLGEAREQHIKILRAQVAALQPAKLNVVSAPEWTPEDAALLKAFLAGALGQKLFLNFQARVLENAITGCQEDGQTVAAAKRAEGWHEALRWLVSLSQVSRVADTNDTQLPDDTEALREAGVS